MRNPQCFYKFVPFERKDILENGLIKFSTIGGFNDPFELEPSISPLSRQYRDYCSTLSEAELRQIQHTEEDFEYSLKRSDLVSVYREKYKNEVAKYGVLSLSSNNRTNHLLTVSVPEKNDPRTNILMWSHYADHHRGFVIEFEASFIKGVEIKAVEYSDDRHILTFEDIDDNLFDPIFYRKSVEWQYEQEYRVVAALENAKTIAGNEHFLFEVDKAQIRSITFGCAMSEDNKSTIMNLVKPGGSFGKVAFNHARLNEEGYFLEFYFDDGSISNNPSSPFAARVISVQKRL